MKRLAILITLLALSAPAFGASGTVDFIWHKKSRGELADVCINPGAASCSVIADNVCHIYAPDNQESFKYLGREFYSCAHGKSASAKVALAGDRMTVNYEFLPFSSTDSACIRATNTNITLPFRIRGSAGGRDRSSWKTGCWVEERNLIIALQPDDIGLAETIGHELKHKVDGLWHQGPLATPRPGVFIH